MQVGKLYFDMKKVNSVLSRETIEKIIMATACFFLGLLTTRGLVFGKYAPFSIAFTAAAPKPVLWMAVIGGFFGYLLPSPIHIPFRYIVALMATAAIRWALSDLKRINTSQFFAPVITFLPLLATGMAISLINESISTMASLYVAEAFMGAGVSFFFSRSVKILLEKRYHTTFDNIDVACLSVSLGVIILSFNEVGIYGISIGRILMVLMVLVCSGAGGISGGAISGVSAGAIGGLSGLGVSYLSGAYGLGGLMAGIFSGVSKTFGIIAFIIAHGVASLQIGENSGVINAALEVAIATVIYILLPENRVISKLFSIRKDKLSGDSLRNNIIMRLNHTSKALTSVAGSVDQISRKLEETNKMKASYVFNQATAEICAGCSLRAVCWRKNKQDSIEVFSALLPFLKARGRVETKDFKSFFRERCSRVGEMKISINKYYQVFQQNRIAQIRSANVRDIASEQFKVTSAMLNDMASEILLYESFDEEAVRRVTEVFRKLEVSLVEVSCRTDKYGRMTIEAEIEKSRNMKLNKAAMVKEISKACGRVFSPPCISNTEFSYKLQMCQKPTLDVKTGLAQESASSLCGDSAISFYDGQGKYIAIISDGMGTGGMAAVDGTMASSIMESLLKAGIGYDTALRMTNSALMSKCEEETLATIDIASLDLHTGRCEFRKAGGASSYIRKGKKVIAIEEDSLPVGIMPEVKFSLSLEQLRKGDLLVLLSDGVTGFGTDWIEEEIENFAGDDPEKLAKDIVLYAKKNRNDGHKDDITAMVIMLCFNGRDEN